MEEKQEEVRKGSRIGEEKGGKGKLNEDQKEGRSEMKGRGREEGVRQGKKETEGKGSKIN